jgi:hypothetical protein
MSESTQLRPLLDCRDCRRAEQALFDQWANEQFGGRPSIAALAGRLNREAALMTEFAIAGDSDLVIDQVAFLVVLAYRVASGLGFDLDERVTDKIAELEAAPDHEERF